MGREVLNNIETIWCKPPTIKEVKLGRHIQFIVIHTIECPETPQAAHNCGMYFQSGAEGRNVSAHYCIGNTNIVQCVQTKDVAFAAPGLNRNGIHLELVGRSKQSSADWHDDFSKAVLRNAAWLAGAVLMPKYKIPIQYCDWHDLKRSKDDTDVKGITTHNDGTLAGFGGTHTDPGDGFPMAEFLNMIVQARQGTLG